jgi:hypothetical protein
MRRGLILLPLLLSASPALAQSATPHGTDADQIARVLSDPATADKLANMIQAMSQAFLDLPAGQVQAAVEGRQPTPVEKRLTVGDVARRHDPDFDRKFQHQVAQAGPMIHQGMDVMSRALPEMMRGLLQAESALKRAAANMPDPNYPKR